MILSPNKRAFEKLLKTINEGNPVVIPTETVYGLAARIDQPDSIKQIFTLKQRPFFDPLIVHIYHADQLKRLTHFESPVLDQLIQKFWPGPLTLVLPKMSQVNPLITSGLDSVGIRMPNHPLALQFLKEVDIPLAAPSANLFGHTSPTKALHVQNDFDSESLLILDGGDCQVGIESTVIKLEKNQLTNQIEICILRKGVITKSMIEDSLKNFSGMFKFIEGIDKRNSPGHMKHHYMPQTPLIFLNQSLDFTEMIQAIEKDFNKIPDEIDGVKIRKPKGAIKKWTEITFNHDPVLACRELYSTLKEVSEKNDDILIFQKKTYMEAEAWEGFLERLNKAASLHY